MLLTLFLVLLQANNLVSIFLDEESAGDAVELLPSLQVAPIEGIVIDISEFVKKIFEYLTEESVVRFFLKLQTAGIVHECRELNRQVLALSLYRSG
jgi:hypothetical protein